MMLQRKPIDSMEVRREVRKPCAHREETIRRLVLVITLFAVPVVGAMRPIVDADIWWHLRVGQWIVEHGTVPMTDPFSSYGLGKLWIAYSWLFEVLVYGLYRAFGLVGLVLYTATFSLLIVVALHDLVRRFEPRFAVAVALTIPGICGIASSLGPRPWLLTILFFVIELDILLAARRSGDSRYLFLLPLLFALWANVHIQFAYGLFVLGLAAVESLLVGSFPRLVVEREARTLPFGRLLLVTVACAVATLATPYHVYLYRPLFEYIGQTGAFQYVDEFQALAFRSPFDWISLAVTLGAVFALGRRQEIRPFPLLLLATGTFLSFRARRDEWFVVIAAVASITTSRSATVVADRFPLTRLRALIVAAALIAVVMVVGRIRNISEHHLESVVAETYPVAAATVVAERGYPGPLYNHFNWGGYLIWSLPHLPVAMDGRTNLHGDARIWGSHKTWTGMRGWDADPELTTARVVISDVNWPLASLLRLDTRFELVYEDDVAAVFIARSRPKEVATRERSLEGKHAHNTKEFLP